MSNMSQEQYYDDKVDVEASLHHAEDKPLLSKQPDQTTVDEQHVVQPQERRRLSTAKKLLLGALAGFLIFSAARACHLRHHRNGLQKWTGDWQASPYAPDAFSGSDHKNKVWVSIKSICQLRCESFADGLLSHTSMKRNG